MSDRIIISIDTMGGANAPRAVIEGAALATSMCPDIHFLMYGNSEMVAPILEQQDKLKGKYELIATASVVLDDDAPVKALRYGKNSSMRLAIDALKEGKAHGCVSSGNTGALMVMAKLVLGMLHDIRRPAIVGVMPNRSGGSVLLDMGANTECDEFNLFQFALMGASYAKICLNRSNPTIGLLNVGTEEIKGTELQKRAYQLLKESNLNFKGYVEGFDLAEGTVDVVVADGFSGNLVLKAAEGTAKLCLDYLHTALRSNLLAKIGGLLASKAIKRQFAKIDPRVVNGAMFAGIDGVVVKSHGNAGAKAFVSAIKLAYDLAKCDINKDISEELRLLRESAPSSLQPNLVDRLKKTLGMG